MKPENAAKLTPLKTVETGVYIATLNVYGLMKREDKTQRTSRSTERMTWEVQNTKSGRRFK